MSPLLQIQMNQVRVVLNHKSSQIYRFQDLWRVGGKHGRQNGRSLHEHRLWDFLACLENQKEYGYGGLEAKFPKRVLQSPSN